ncbi:MAG: anti-sigma factor antagonist [Clostridia bacterium]|nr:anti-sigma factor antagonist [Clostridia bacterium]
MIKSNCGFEYELCERELYVRLSGEVDHHSAVRLRQDVDALICETRPESMVLDLSEVGFMDSSGLGFIMGRYSLLRELGGTMVIADPSPATVRILELAGIKRIIPVRTGEESENK